MKQVITSTNLNKDYYFFTPIIYFAWKNLGYNLNLFIPDFTAHLLQETFFTKVLDELKINSLFIPNYGFNMPYKYRWALAPLSRLYGCDFDLADNDYLLTTDIDMIPLNNEWFNNIDENRINIYGEDGQTGGYGHSRYPICYIGMTVDKWKRIIRYDTSLDIKDNINRALGQFSDLSEGQWRSLDEVYFHYLFNIAPKELKDLARFYFRKMIPNPSFKGHDNKTPFILPEGRIDRSNWDLSNLSTAIDAHCPRPGYTDENWNKILPVLEKALTKDQLLYINGYRKDFVKWITD